MTFPRPGVAVLIAVLGGGSPLALAQAAVVPTSQMVLASHKPLMETTVLAAPSPPQFLNRSIDQAPEASSLAVPTMPAAIELALQPADGRISQAIKRYAESHGWQLAWEIERDFPIEYPATFTGDFLGIIEQVVLSLQNSDAPIRVKVYEANRVLRVVHATQ